MAHRLPNLVMICVLTCLAGGSWAQAALQTHVDASSKSLTLASRSREYYFQSSLWSYLRSNTHLQKHLSLSANEYDELRQLFSYSSRQLRKNPRLKTGEGRRDAMISILGKNRYQRLRQVYCQIYVRQRRDLYNRLVYHREFAGNLVTDDEFKKIRQAQDDYQAEYQKLRKLYKEKKIDATTYNSRRNMVWQNFYQRQDKLIGNELWKRFQTYCGEKFKHHRQSNYHYNGPTI